MKEVVLVAQKYVVPHGRFHLGTEARTPLTRIASELSVAVGDLRLGPPVTHVYNPLQYAWTSHALYLERFGKPPKEVVFVGMNPGPWGMAQTGVPFGEVDAVRSWLGIDVPIGRPSREHARRPVDGMACNRSEVSGRRVWTWAKALFGTPQAFFERFFVHNYCPLLFLEESGRNRTPDRLPTAERGPLFDACDRALAQTVAYLEPQLVIGVGAFAAGRTEQALEGMGVRVGQILHPSPASPAANRGWAEQATAALEDLGVSLPKEGADE